MSRRSLLAAGLLVAGLASTSTPAVAATACHAVADQPYTAGANVLGGGSFVCDTAAAGMTVTVCVESAALLAPLTWVTENCSTRSVSSPTSAVHEDVSACVQGGFKLVRIAVSGSNAEGHEADAVSTETLAPGVGSCGP